MRLILLSGTLLAAAASAQTQIKGRVLLMFDSSGSMTAHFADNLGTGGDGSLSYQSPVLSRSVAVNRNLGLYVGFDPAPQLCGATASNNVGSYDGVNSRMFAAKAAVSNLINAAGSIDWGLMRYSGTMCPLVNTIGGSNNACTNDFNCPPNEFCITGTCHTDNNLCFSDGLYGLTYDTGGGVCGDFTPLPLTYSGNCGTSAAAGDAACATAQACFADAECTGGGAGRCALIGTGPARSCSCTSAAQCPAGYTCSGGRCVYNLPCQTAATTTILVDPLTASSNTLIPPWVDGVEDYRPNGTVPTNPELRGSGTTPLAASIRASIAWYNNIKNGALDTQLLCRPYVLVLLTDGDDSCEDTQDGGSLALGPIAAARGFVAATAPNARNLNKVYVIGLSSVGASAAELNAIAAAGGTSTARFANSQADIQAALADIQASTVLIEKCNNADDDCNNLCDEPFPDVATSGVCGNRAAKTCTNGALAGTHCFASGALVCSTDQLSQVCSAQTCATNAALCPLGENAVAGNKCNGVDDDCNGVIDDCTAFVAGSCCTSACPACAAGGPFPETCNGCDDNCDGVVDDSTIDTAQSCGSNVGRCTLGSTACCQQPNGSPCTQSQLQPPASNPDRLVCVGATPPAAAQCNGCDNDCDGQLDRPSQACYTGAAPTRNVGACRDGTQTCTATVCPSAATFSACTGQVTPAAETCNGRDDDCNGTSDDNLTDPWVGTACCSTGNLADCQNTGAGTRCSTGTFSCQAGGPRCLGGVSKTVETCNGIDDDCNGVIDDVPGLGSACSGGGINSTGICRGAFVCTGAPGPGPRGLTCQQAVSPGTEVCNGVDDDCNGATDDGVTGVGVACGPDAGACMPGSTACTNGVLRCTGGSGPQLETCNGLDDDCNGTRDDNLTDPWAGTACCSTGNVADCQNTGTGTRCQAGANACVNGARACTGTTVAKTVETCNGIDDDCNGAIDDVPGVGGPCTAAGLNTTGACRATFACVNGALTCTQAVAPGPEVCNGLDDDCDGEADDSTTDTGMACGACDGGTCTGQCATGFVICVRGAKLCDGARGPTAEVCDGADNDCDGMIDEAPTDAWLGMSCCPTGNPMDCTNAGGASRCSAGAWACMAGMRTCLGATARSTEGCNGLDDDCDGVTDDVLAAGQACTASGVSALGRCSAAWACGASMGPGPDGLTCMQGRAPVAETCDGTDEDCDGVVDDGAMGVGLPCGDGGTCGGQTACVSGVLQCNGARAPSEEICDGIDDDCDGMVDDGAACPTGFQCVSRECVQACTADAQCPGGQRCTQGYCIPQSCVCGACEVCKGNFCVDACGELSCTAGTHCDCGACLPDAGTAAKGCGCSGSGADFALLGIAALVLLRARRKSAVAVALFVACGSPSQPDAGGPGSPCTAAQLQTDPWNCGTCGHACVYNHAAGTCTAATCGLGACQPGWLDANHQPQDGCEARCFARPGGEGASCNGLDDDCNGLVDDGIDLSSDVLNCGACGHACELNFATGSCADGGCVLGACDSTHANVDGRADNGCEYACPVVPPVPERCNGKDDDCDGVIDDTPGDVGGSCGSGLGACTAGTLACLGGTRVCMGAGAPSVERCNAVDDDCNGSVDDAVAEAWTGQSCCPSGNLAECANTDGGTRCMLGSYACAGGGRVCLGAVERGAERCNGLDDDCNGAVDDVTGAGTGCTDADAGINVTGVCRAAYGCRGTTAGPGPNGLTCLQAVGPSSELCNGLDDDCDGTIDDSPGDVGTACGTLCPGGTAAGCIGACVAGTYACTNGARVCVGSRGGTAELCNGIDDDCDGTADDAVTDSWVGQACCSSGNLSDCLNTGAGTRCRAAAFSCAGGTRACSGSVAKSVEVCNGVDDDCNGVIDDVAGAGTPCSGGGANGAGQCRAVYRCAGGAPGPGPNGLTCTQTVGPTSELCNGLDDDCDGTADNAPADVGVACGSSCPGGTVSGCVGECRAGATVCSGGAKICSGSTGPSAELCDARDNDCNGVVDDGFGYPSYNSNPSHCGACNSACNLANASNGCHSDATIDPSGGGVCFVTACTTSSTAGFRYVPSPGTVCGGASPLRDGPGGIGCNYACPVWPSTAETCNGRDDDCDGFVDDLNSTCAPGLVPPSICSNQGVCLGQAIPVVCGGASGWRCNYAGVPNVELDGTGALRPTEARCDGRDGNCNGTVDLDGFPSKGQTCTAGLGVCQNTGTLVCNGAETAVTCNVTAQPANAVDELCDGKDNDCDGLIDERTAGSPVQCTNGGLHVCAGWRDPMVLINGVWTYVYEASRPDSTGASQGGNSSRACSKPGVLPWSTVTRLQAEAACAAIRDSANVPMRLCSAPEWTLACEAGAPAATKWSESVTPTVNASGVCNDVNQRNPDAVWATATNGVASGAVNGFCYSDATAAPGVQTVGGLARFYDMSGNVAEWTSTPVTAGGVTYYKLRGGSFTSPPNGTTCEFDFAIARDTFASPDLGFRCCSVNAP